MNVPLRKHEDVTQTARWTIHCELSATYERTEARMCDAKDLCCNQQLMKYYPSYTKIVILMLGLSFK